MAAGIKGRTIFSWHPVLLRRNVRRTVEMRCSEARRIDRHSDTLFAGKIKSSEDSVRKFGSLAPPKKTRTVALFCLAGQIF
jgi:hypothetical protein